MPDCSHLKCSLVGMLKMLPGRDEERLNLQKTQAPGKRLAAPIDLICIDFVLISNCISSES